MKLKRLKKVIALSIVLTMAAPTAVFAAEPPVMDAQTEEIISQEPEDSPAPENQEEQQEPETPQEPPKQEITQEPQNPQKPQNPEAPSKPQEPQNPEAPSKPQEPPSQEEQQKPETPEEPLLPDDEILPGTGDEAEEESEEEDSLLTNEELIASQEIISVPEIKEDFRFWTVARKYAFAAADMEIREAMTKDALAVGNLPKDGVCFVLKEEENGWLYVESGKVRGFVLAEEVLTGEAANPLLTKYQKEAQEKAAEQGITYTGIEMAASTAEELIPYMDNEAFQHLRATAEQTVVEKEYAVTIADLLNVREEKNAESRITGVMSAGSLCYILADKDSEWVYIESGDVRGFVKGEFLKTGKETEEEVLETGEENYPKAQEEIPAAENRACYYTLTSVKSGVPGSRVRETILSFASQFIGNPYVWGGTSLTDGADCSGFVQGIYREYGYSLPRTAAAQAQCGTKIKVEDVQPGDLIFYARNGEIYHVVIYAGEGKTVEAMGTDYGIVQGNLNTSNAVWAVKILDDTPEYESTGEIAEINATKDMYGDFLGKFKLTYYCACEICCDVETGITATGAPVVEGHTIAVDPKVIPYGTKVIINGHIFTAEDCGGAIKENRIDIYVNSHEKALQLGTGYADVYLLR